MPRVVWIDLEAHVRCLEHLGFLAHQIRSPLSAVMLSLAQLHQKLGPSAGEGIDVLDRMERNLNRTRELIDDVLMLESLEAEQVDTRLVDTTLGTIVDDAVHACRQSAEAKGLAFRVAYDPGVRIRTDPKLVLSALEHLLENAVNYTDSGEVSLTVENRPDCAVFHVTDTGPGLSDEELNIIFEPFRRGRTGKSGSGLGLAIVKREVTTLGGEVHAESTGEQGSHFWFTAPKTHH